MTKTQTLKSKGWNFQTVKLIVQGLVLPIPESLDLDDPAEETGLARPVCFNCKICAIQIAITRPRCTSTFAEPHTISFHH